MEKRYYDSVTQQLVSLQDILENHAVPFDSEDAQIIQDLIGKQIEIPVFYSFISSGLHNTLSPTITSADLLPILMPTRWQKFVKFIKTTILFLSP
jgi:hypothetical protein